MSGESLCFQQILLSVFHLRWPPGSRAAANADVRRVVGHDVEVRVGRQVRDALQHSSNSGQAHPVRGSGEEGQGYALIGTYMTEKSIASLLSWGEAWQA